MLDRGGGPPLLRRPLRSNQEALMPVPRNAAKPHSRANRGTVGSRQALIDIPASGCDLPVPAMPAGRQWSEAEQARWAELWASPQACQWDETARGTVAALVIYESAIMA